MSNNENESNQNKTVPKSKDDNHDLLQKDINKNSESWIIKFLSQIKLESNHLQFVVPKHWLEKGKGVQHPIEDKKLILLIQTIERTTKHNSKLDKNYKDERSKANKIDSATDSDEESVDPLYKDDPIYGDKKDYIEEKYISEKDTINTLNIIFEENTIWDLGYQVTWFNQDISQSVC